MVAGLVVLLALLVLCVVVANRELAALGGRILCGARGWGLVRPSGGRRSCYCFGYRISALLGVCHRFFRVILCVLLPRFLLSNTSRESP